MSYKTNKKYIQRVPTSIFVQLLFFLNEDCREDMPHCKLYVNAIFAVSSQPPCQTLQKISITLIILMWAYKSNRSTEHNRTDTFKYSHIPQITRWNIFSSCLICLILYITYRNGSFIHAPVPKVIFLKTIPYKNTDLRLFETQCLCSLSKWARLNAQWKWTKQSFFRMVTLTWKQV